MTASAVSVAALAAGAVTFAAPSAFAATVTGTANYSCNDTTPNSTVTVNFNRSTTTGKLGVTTTKTTPLPLAAGQLHVNWGSVTMANATSFAAGDQVNAGPISGVATLTAPPATLSVVIDPSTGVPGANITCTYITGTANPALPWSV